MKKLFSVILILVLLCSISVCAFAEEKTAKEEKTVMNWEDAEKTMKKAGIKGDFVTLDEVEVKMWLPDTFQPVELTPEDLDSGYIAYYATEDSAAAIAVVYVDVGGMKLDEYLKALKDLGIEDAEIVTVNGNEAVSYTLEDNDSASLSFATDQGYILEFTFAPRSDEAFGPIGAAILTSVQAVEEAAEQTAEK